MISASNFKVHFHQIFRIMRDTGMSVELHSNGRVYRIHAEDMKQRYKVPNRGRKKLSYKGQIDTRRCPECRKLMINGICMNVKCKASSA